MAPKKKFTKEQIINAAFEIAKEEGISKITIRKVADQLGSSIAPIYVNFKDIDELIQEVIKKVVELGNQVVSEQDSGRPLHDSGVASLCFAREYSILFREFVMGQNEYMRDYEKNMNPNLFDRMKEDSELQGFTEEELKAILFKMRVFTTGLAVMVANGLLPEKFTEESVIELLDHTANDIITSARLSQQELLD
ncbi:TetR/AcrR family transcriptional regulator [Lederbergia panacisoli]|uniref:TetR/AcrR family transcriptional regulator n=1 Tax=Lederbergia panacisoli TaxID=1255251 RepID=UPI00214CEAF7|nr:TetR family transcriptional regulator [Lederbergia panacisoli]MCR2821746.1 TetR family transcriptional regulator [Lederbergia panacisoli]